MPDSKITALTAITTVNPATFPLVIVDTSDTSMATTGTTKKVTTNQLLGAGGTATLASATITGDLTVDTNVLKVDSANNFVGVGTTTGVNLAAGRGNLTIGGSSSAILNLSIGAADTGYVIHDGTSIYLVNRIAAGSLVFSTNSTERLRIDSSGNVGIGVQPSAWASNRRALQVGGLAAAALALNGTSNVSEMFFNSFINTSASNVYAVNGRAGLIDFGSGGFGFSIDSGTQTAGAACNFTRAMALDASGNLLVGKTANYGTGETQTLQLKSSVIFGSDNTGSASNRNWSIGTNTSAAGSMEWTISSTNTGWPNFAYRMQITSAGDVNNTTGTYGTISDLRLKENISDARNYLADLLKLRVVKYSLKEEASAVATKLGFIAQEVEQVFPNLVDQSDKEYEGAEGIRSVKTSILIPMLLKAIQELTARVQTLETR